METFDFNKSYKKKKLRNAPDSTRKQKLGPLVEVGDGHRPAGGYYPYKHLPVLEKDDSTHDYRVIPKGRIVSLILEPQYLSKYASGFPVSPSGYNGEHDLDTYNHLNASGGESPFTLGGDTLDADLDSYFGIWKHAAGLLVPANNGIDITYGYSAMDEEAGTINENGKIATSDGEMDIDANIPIGIAHNPIFQDKRGFYLNWENWDYYGILADHYIEVPYIDTNADEFRNFEPPTSSVNVTDDSPDYWRLQKGHTFLTIDSEDGGIGSVQSGNLIQPDVCGNYDIVSTALDESIDAQTVGKLINVQYRFPQDYLDEVDVYPGSMAGGGTETGGLPWHLFYFAHDVCLINDDSTKIDDIVDVVESGKIGLARIQLHVS